MSFPKDSVPQVLAIIPARGGSKGIPRKNIKSLMGKPLLEYTADAALNSQFITRAILSTEDLEIAALGKSLGLEVPFLRPTCLAQDDTPSLPVFQDVLNTLIKTEDYQPDVIVILQPTSPFRTHIHIDQAIQLYLDHQPDSVVSVTSIPHNMTPYSAMTVDNDGYLLNYLDVDESLNMRQLKPTFFARNGAAIYITSVSSILHHNTLFGKKILPYIMSKRDSIDLDDSFDWFLAELLIQSSLGYE